MYSLRKRLLTEFFGTFWLVFAGCGSAVIAAGFPSTGIGFAGVALAFGLSVVTIAYSLGHISGAHLNPAITVGLVAARKFSREDLLPYVGVQILGAIVASLFLYWIASGSPNFDLATHGF